MQELMQQLWATLSEAAAGYLPKLAGAVGILVLFWLGGLVLAAIVRGALRKAKFGEWMARRTVGEERREKVDTERWVSRGVFYIVMIFGLIAFFNALGLLLVTEPLNRMLGGIFEFAPRVLSAGLLLLLGFVVAGLVRLVLSKGLSAVNLDRRLGQTEEESERRSISQTVSTTTYWLILLLFLPLVLDALSLEGVLDPLQSMLGKVLGFLPNLFAAALILFVGWLAARILRGVVTNLLATSGLDDAGQKAGVGNVLGKHTLSGVVGLLLFALVLIPVAIAALEALQLGNISEPAGRMLSTLLQAIPAVLTAGLILTIAYVAGRFAASLVTELLTRFGFDNVLGLMGLSRREQDHSPSAIVGYLVLVAAMFFAAIEACRQLGLDALAGLLVQFAEFAGHVLLGLAILGVGLYLANLAARVIQAGRPQERGLLAAAARTGILVLAAFMALREVGLGEEIINMTFAFVFGAVAVAFALAFGLGARDVAGRHVERWTKSLGSGGAGGTGGPAVDR